MARRRIAGRSWDIPAEGRESAAMRRVTTSLVAAIAAGTLGASLAWAPGAGEAQQPLSQEAETTAQTDEATQTGSATRDDGLRTTDATLSATASGVRATEADVLVTGDGDFGSTAEFAQLTQAISDFEAQGWDVGLELVDLASGRTLSYQADRDFYCASTIKAPYTVAGYQLLVDTGQVGAGEVDELAQAEIVESDNDAYLSLRDVFGVEAFATWLEEAGVTPGVYPSLSELAQTHYPHLTCSQLATMWRQIYAYLSTGGGSAQTLAGYLRDRQVSPIREALGGSYETWSKAGWIDLFSDGGVEPATWDAGVVFATSGTYVIVVGSTAPARLTSLDGVIAAADGAHDAIMADTTTSDAGLS